MTSPSNDNHAAAPRCPLCSKQAARDYAPFCSKRCANLDLHRWLTGGYAIPAVEDDDDGLEDSEPSGEQ